MKTKKRFSFRIPSINVDSVQSYFSLPKGEREWCGLYRKPFALPWELFDIDVKNNGWDFFYATIKKEYPIQYFFREWILSFENPLYHLYKKYIAWPLSSLKSSIKLFIQPFYPRWRKSLPRHQYLDISQLIVESNFALILDFYHDEVIDGYVDWDQDEKHSRFHKELISNVKWIEIERNGLDKKINEALTKAVKNKIKVDGKLDYKSTYSEVENLEEQKNQKENEILKWLIDNKHFFWS